MRKKQSKFDKNHKLLSAAVIKYALLKTRENSCNIIRSTSSEVINIY